MRLLIVSICMIILFGVPLTARAQDIDRLEFDARLLDPGEKRIVQAALALSGDYVGLLDGLWGQGSQSALERYSGRTAGTGKPLFRHIKPLLEALAAEIDTNDWQTVYFESTDTSYAHPLGLLAQSPDRSVIRHDAYVGRLTLFVNFEALAGTLAVHQYFMDEAAREPDPYQHVAAGRLITSVTLRDGLLAYVRSDNVDGGYITLAIIAGEEHRGRLALMAASMQRGRAPDLALPTSGVVAHLLRGQEAGGNSSQSSALDLPDPEDRNPFGGKSAPVRQESPSGNGTGFYVNNTDIVTARHVIEGCRRVTLADGTPLTVIAADEALDLAVLASPLRSPFWLELSGDIRARLGESVIAIGYPYLGRLNQGLTATTGNVSALQGIDGGSNRIMISAPVQPGNSGGPLLNGRGSVIGVVVSRVDDLVILQDTGTLPQNMNFATPNDRLRAFLTGAQVLFPEATGRRLELTEGIPDELSAAVVPVFCY